MGGVLRLGTGRTRQSDTAACDGSVGCEAVGGGHAGAPRFPPLTLRRKTRLEGHDGGVGEAVEVREQRAALPSLPHIQERGG